MKIVLAGEKNFGAAVLRDLVEAAFDVALVVAPPGDVLRVCAEFVGIPARSWPRKLIGSHLPERVDLIVCARFPRYVARSAREAARFGAIGYHPSLLPRHRGPDSVRDTIRAGDDLAGGVVFELAEEWDTGEIYATGICRVLPGEDAGELWRRALRPLGRHLLLETVLALREGTARSTPQRLHEAEERREIGEVLGYGLEGDRRSPSLYGGQIEANHPSKGGNP